MIKITNIDTMKEVAHSYSENVMMKGSFDCAVWVNGVYVRIWDIFGTPIVKQNIKTPSGGVGSKKLGKKLSKIIVDFAKENIEKMK